MCCWLLTSRTSREVILAHASFYLRDLLEQLASDGLPEMALSELVHVLCILVYVAHTYVQDHTCAIQHWHKYLFRQYCSLKTLNTAVIGLLQRIQFRLRLPPAELAMRMAFFQEKECGGDSDEAEGGTSNEAENGKVPASEASPEMSAVSEGGHKTECSALSDGDQTCKLSATDLSTHTALFQEGKEGDTSDCGSPSD
eukprot:1663507-Amphidinium_carterae.1